MRRVLSCIALTLALGPLVPTVLGAQSPEIRAALAAMPPWRDSLVISAGDRSLGAQVIAWQREDDGFAFRERTSIGPAVWQATTVRVTADGRIASVRQEGEARGVAMATELTYEPDGRVHGRSTNPGPDGAPVTQVIDTVLPAGTVDDNAVPAVVVALPWEAGASWALPVFSSGQNRLTERVLRHAGAVPAGPGHRVELTGPDATVTFDLRDPAPHRLLGLAVEGAPLTFERVD